MTLLRRALILSILVLAAISTLRRALRGAGNSVRLPPTAVPPPAAIDAVEVRPTSSWWRPLLGPVLLVLLALAAGYFGSTLLPPSYPTPPLAAGSVDLFVSDSNARMELRVFVDADGGPASDYRLLLASDTPRTIRWAVAFSSDARFRDPRDPGTYPDSTAIFGITGGEIVDGPDVQVASGEASVGTVMTEVARISGEVPATYFYSSGGSKTVVDLPSYGGSGVVLPPPGGDARAGLIPKEANRVVVDVETGVALGFVRIDAASPPLAGGQLHWEAEHGLSRLRVAYTDLVKEANEQSRLFLAGIVLSFAAGAAIAAVQMLTSNASERTLVVRHDP